MFLTCKHSVSALYYSNCFFLISFDSFYRVKQNYLSTLFKSYRKPCQSCPLLPKRLDNLENITKIAYLKHFSNANYK